MLMVRMVMGAMVHVGAMAVSPLSIIRIISGPPVLKNMTVKTTKIAPKMMSRTVV
jgi:hypothetical protein